MSERTVACGNDVREVCTLTVTVPTHQDPGGLFAVLSPPSSVMMLDIKSNVHVSVLEDLAAAEIQAPPRRLAHDPPGYDEEGKVESGSRLRSQSARRRGWNLGNTGWYASGYGDYAAQDQCNDQGNE